MVGALPIMGVEHGAHLPLHATVVVVQPPQLQHMANMSALREWLAATAYSVGVADSGIC